MTKDQYLAPALENLKKSVSSLNVPDSLDRLIAQHFDIHSRLNQFIDWCKLPSLDDWLSSNSDYLSQAPKLATLGMLLINNPKDAAVEKVFLTTLGGIQKRPDDFGLSTSWALQPGTVLGIGLGIRFVDDQLSRQWFIDLLDRGSGNKQVSVLPKLMFLYLNHLFDRKTPRISPASLIEDRYGCSVIELAFAIWLAEQEIGDWSHEDRIDWLVQNEAAFLHRLASERSAKTEDYKAALIWIVATNCLYRPVEAGRSIGYVAYLLGNFSNSLERWRSDWKIKDETDIQRIVYLIMRTQFDDATYEENLPKLGRRGHRYDIGILQLKLLIEIKYARKASDFNDFVEQVGQDVAQIYTQTSYTSFIVFIYDPTSSTQNYGWVRETLLKFEPIKHVVIITAPSSLRN